ncbi:substrate-binding domain-containing protein [Lactobacillus corticis]|uniref:Catabolite control protein A n=1 Tax=Lactobacillus corticis TaxID=2201249 RepID=A0A916QIZ7_9LACO|nr:substrate-binding domain-containing protein [Lactobacillus corticis]GFZ27338.1 catabolite control protein A [Lactobacillus corticis]
MHKQDVTIYDVAREAKVSMATVSRVVNGNSNVRKETRERVMEVIKRLHYQPNAVAQGLASKRTTTVGLVVPDLTNLYFAELSKGIDDIAHLYKYNIIITSIENQLVNENQTIQSLLNKQVDGVIYMSNDLSDSTIEAFDRTNTPVVLAGTVDSRGKYPSVTIDYDEATLDVFGQLYQDGKHHLAWVVGDTESSVNRDHRIKAYREFCQEKGMEPHIYGHKTNYHDGYELYADLAKDGIDGVVVTRDLVACGILNAALDAGKSVPDDFEIITASATPMAQVARPSLTCVKQPLYDMGAVAMRLLTKLMNNEDIDEQEIKLPYELMRKATTLNK